MVKQHFWIVDILCDEETAEKIQDDDHRVTYDMVCEAVRLGRYELAKWRVRGDDKRLFVVGRSDAGVRLLAILRPVDKHDGKWRLGSAWRMSNDE